MKLDRFQPTIKYLEEPLIEVGENIAVPEPKMGLTLLGPLGDNSARYDINIGLIGDSQSIEKTKNMIEKFNVTTYGKNKSSLHVDFPGLDKLRIKFNVKREAEMDNDTLKQKIENTPSFSARVEQVGNIIREKIKAIMDVEPVPHILILAYPEIVDEYCIKAAVGQRGLPRKTSLEKSIEKTRAKNQTLDRFFGLPPPPVTYRPTDLRSLVKAICMDYDIPVQILRPSTTEPYNLEHPIREDDATTFWNLVVAAFYKSNHLPWRVKGILNDTCYIGISFFRDRDDSSVVKTSLAQFFSLDSEGYVFKGKKAIIDEYNAPHVSKEEARELIERAIEVYKANKGDCSPRRIVVHKTSRFTEDEKIGFQEGAKEIAKLDLIAFGTRDIKLLRWGQQPPIRGTMVRLPDNSVLLYTFGYIPYLDVYPGPRVPAPLEIIEHHGSTSVDIICKEILALTKLNWNSAKFCIKAPITVSFARRVGFFLRNAPPTLTPKGKFKFYM
ncbi:MAG: hypothetical protein LBC03_01480 [Nitrososphaerota archaeon]|jgi:hypothetical protein|nr:hypothetical protein [Nitrososphaerota archaeon]